MWTFGVLEPNCYGAVVVDSGKTHLFVPRQPPEYAIWSGPILTLEEYGNKYAIENVHYADQVRGPVCLQITFLPSPVFVINM